MYFISIYENRRLKTVEIVLRWKGRGRRRTKEEVDITKIYYKYLCKYYIVSPCIASIC
jgi:hypothetical protein